MYTHMDGSLQWPPTKKEDLHEATIPSNKNLLKINNFSIKVLGFPGNAGVFPGVLPPRERSSGTSAEGTSAALGTAALPVAGLLAAAGRRVLDKNLEVMGIPSIFGYFNVLVPKIEVPRNHLPLQTIHFGVDSIAGYFQIGSNW